MREAKGLSQYALTKEAKVSREYVRKLEAGESDPTVGMLQRLSHALGVPLVDLLVDREGWLAEDSETAPVFQTRAEAEAMARSRRSRFVWRLFEAGAVPRIRGPYPVRDRSG